MSFKSVKSHLNHSASKLKAFGLLSVGTLLLLGNGSAFAGQNPVSSLNNNLSNTSTYNKLLSQNRGGSGSGDIVIDEEPGASRSPSGTSTTPDDSAPRFGCETNNGQYTVMYYPDGIQANAQPWAVPGQLGGGWDPQSRCVAITNRLEEYRQYGLLELKTGMENNMATVCATTETKPGCLIVLTVPPGQKAIDVRNRIFDNLLVADSGGQIEGVYTFTGGSSKLGQIFNKGSRSGDINLQRFLTPGDRRAVTNQRPQQGGSKVRTGTPKIFQR